jgi:hypothetical protein
MPQDIMLELGDHGEIAVETQFVPPGAVPAGFIGDYIRDSLADALAASLVGFGQAMGESIPQQEDAAYALEKFTLEFNVGLGGEVGADGGVTGVSGQDYERGQF